MSDNVHYPNASPSLIAKALSRELNPRQRPWRRLTQKQDVPPAKDVVDLISPAIRAELDQTPEWWQCEYDALVKKQIPRDSEYHRDHAVEEPISFYAAGYALNPRCLDCGVTIASTE